MSPDWVLLAMTWVLKLEGLTQATFLPSPGTPHVSLHSLTPGLQLTLGSVWLAGHWPQGHVGQGC